VFLLLCWVCISGFTPPFECPLLLDLVMPTAKVGRTEPLIATGRFEAGDFLVVTYPAADTAVISYDAWGHGGPSSPPIAFTPGSRHRLAVDMPTLVGSLGTSAASRGRLRVHWDNRVVIDAEVPFHRHAPGQVFFGTNPIGGNTDGGAFSGEIRTATGRRLKGRSDALWSGQPRWLAWLRHAPGQLLMILALAAIAGGVTRKLAQWCHSRGSQAGHDSAAAPIWSKTAAWALVAAAPGVLAFGWLVTGATGRLFEAENYGAFYDYQAASLLQGRLDVAEEGIRHESFVYQGRHYGYFGPTPAVLRIPFSVLNVGFTRLSRSFMTVYFIAALTASYLVLREATRLVRGPDAKPAPWAAVALMVNVGLGSTVFFLGTRAYIYHEAILCGVAFALWSTYCSLRWQSIPTSRWWIGSVVCGLFAVHARPPVGLFALTLVATSAGVIALRVRADTSDPPATEPATPPRPPWRRLVFIMVLAAAAVLSFNALSYLKFRTIEGCPLRYNVLYSPARLARIDGRQFHWRNLGFGLDAYLVRPTLVVDARFPFFHFAKVTRAEYPAAKIDMIESIVGLPYAMPGLVGLTLLATAWWMLRDRRCAHPLLALWAAVVPMGVAMFAAIAVSHRYTADFCPFLIAAAAFGLAAIESAAPGWRTLGRALLLVLTLGAVLITSGLALGYQGEGVWGVPETTKKKYQHLKQTVDGWIQRQP
jgi:hypothetical protein